MVKKVGLDPNRPSELSKAIELLTRNGLIDEKTGSSWAQICLMSKSLSTAEFATCLAKDPTLRATKPNVKAHREEKSNEDYDYLMLENYLN